MRIGGLGFLCTGKMGITKRKADTVEKSVTTKFPAFVRPKFCQIFVGLPIKRLYQTTGDFDRMGRKLAAAAELHDK